MPPLNGAGLASAATEVEAQKIVGIGQCDDKTSSRIDPALQPVWTLHYQTTPVAEIVPDAKWPGMFRVLADGHLLSDIRNLARAKDAALAILERGPPRRNPNLLRWKFCPVRDGQRWPLVCANGGGAP